MSSLGKERGGNEEEGDGFRSESEKVGVGYYGKETGKKKEKARASLPSKERRTPNRKKKKTAPERGKKKRERRNNDKMRERAPALQTGGGKGGEFSIGRNIDGRRSKS